VREAARLAGTAAAAEKRRGGRSAQRRGLRSPAKLPGRRGARDRQQTALAGCSPPGAGLGRLTVTRQRRRRGFHGGSGARVSGSGGADVCGSGGSGESVQGAAADINSPGRPPWLAGHAKGACAARTRRRRRRSPGRRRRGGRDDRWGPWVSDCVRGRAG
jgi:hypothetical protein